MTRALHVLAACALALSFARVAAAQADTVRADSAQKKRPFISWRDVAMLEAFAIATVASAPLDRSFAERLQNPSVQQRETWDEIARFVEGVTDPGAVVIGVSLYTYGRIWKNRRAADLGLHGLEALAIGHQLGTMLKGFIGRARPYVDITNPHDYQTFRGFLKGSDYRSFPSGHSIAAFAAASAVTSETKRWWPRTVWIIGPLMYGGAATVAWSRMFDNKHWATDVITGAAIGTFVGLKVVHFHHHTRPDTKFDRIFLGTTVAPATDGSALVRFHFRAGP
jgi:membrane-associated phospholipid phosphatase